MPRKIAFRAWDENGKIMYPEPYNHDTANLNLALKLAQEGGYILEQFTGLLDKNGEEIYEGDIVQDIGADGEPIETVEWSGASFDIRADWTDHNLAALAGRGRIKRIGNIHENPELLNT